jgi:hypothetical protein
MPEQQKNTPKTSRIGRRPSTPSAKSDAELADEELKKVSGGGPRTAPRTGV